MPNDILTRAIDEVSAGTHLTADHTSAALAEIMEGRVSEVQTAAFLISLRAKGETVSELVGLARTMRQLAAHVEIDKPDLLDTAGTGGGPTTFNISTTAALIAAGAGCSVAKHGNRSATSRSGSADVLEALGVDIDLSPGEVATCIDEIGFGFMFAPKHHKAMAHVVPVRKELAVRTVFNFLGPLTNPAGASAHLLGVSDRRYQEIIADALVQLGTAHALVVSADDGIDELSIASRTRVIEVAEGGTEEWFVDPDELGLARAPLDAIPGAEPAENAAVVRSVLEGETGPTRDVSVLNAGAAIYVAGGASDLREGLTKAGEAIDSGAAGDMLARLVARSRELSGAS
jgi:anthranilate phosphoribosyltransferase